MKIIDKNLMDDLSAKAAAAPRLRAHYNLHETLEEPIHRLVMACAIGTYIRPHRHLESNKFELFTILRGRGVILTFTSAGVISKKIELQPGKTSTVELAPEEWHTFFPLEANTVVMEVKPGPYIPVSEADSAAWAPAEGTQAAIELAAWFPIAAEGESNRKLQS